MFPVPKPLGVLENLKTERRFCKVSFKMLNLKKIWSRQILF